MQYGQRRTFDKRGQQATKLNDIVLGSDDVAARSQPNHYLITVRMVNPMAWLLDVYLNLHLPVVEPLPWWEESPVFGNVPARMEVAAVVRVVA